MAVYLIQYQLIPYKRGSELIDDMFGIKLSQGTIVNFNKSCYDALMPIENNIKNSITNDAGAIHFDETGIYIDKKRQSMTASKLITSILIVITLYAMLIF